MLERGRLQGVATSRTTWKEYWSFWCDKVQPAYRKKTGKRIFGIGQPMGVDSSDSFYSFLTFMDAYNVKLVDDNGKLLVDDPKVQAGPDRRADRLHRRRTRRAARRRRRRAGRTRTTTSPSTTRRRCMTHNATISIAAKWLDDMNNDDAHARAARAGEEELRRADPHRGLPEQARRLARWSTAPRSRPAWSSRTPRTRQRAKEFVAFLLQEENLTPYVEGSLGRWFPVTKAGAGEPVLAGRPASQVGLQPVQGRHGDVRIHQELQVHDPQQRERLGQGDEPRRQREGAGRQGGRRDDRPHQGRSPG